MMREWARFWETGRVDDYLTAKRSEEAAQGRRGRGEGEGADSRWNGEASGAGDERTDRAAWNG